MACLRTSCAKVAHRSDRTSRRRPRSCRAVTSCSKRRVLLRWILRPAARSTRERGPSRRSRRKAFRPSGRVSRCRNRPSTRRTSGCASRTSRARSPRRKSSSAAGVHLTENGRYTSPLAAELAGDAVERFLRYVRIDTQSDDDSTSSPSTEKQRQLGELLARELRELGLDGVELTEHGYVFASLPGRRGPTIGFIAHMD